MAENLIQLPGSVPPRAEQGPPLSTSDFLTFKASLERMLNQLGQMMQDINSRLTAVEEMLGLADKYRQDTITAMKDIKASVNDTGVLENSHFQVLDTMGAFEGIESTPDLKSQVVSWIRSHEPDSDIELREKVSHLPLFLDHINTFIDDFISHQEAAIEVSKNDVEPEEPSDV